MTECPLKYLLDLNDSGTWGQDPTGEDDVPVLRSTDIQLDGSWRIHDPALRHVTGSDKVRKRLATGDIVVVKSSGSPEHLGKSAIVTEDVAAMGPYFANFVQRLRPSASTDSRYIWYVLNSKRAADEMARLGNTTTGLRNLNGAIIGSVRIPVTRLAEQRAIVDYLDTETSRIDTLITKKRRMIELCEERWRSMVEYRMRSLMNTQGTIALKRVVVCLDGRRIPLSAEERSSRRGPYPYYGASGVIDSVDSYLFDETLVLLSEDGAQLADPDYDVSFVVRGKVWVNNHAHVLRPVATDPTFLAMHLTTLDRGAFISGATREKITQADMNEIPVPNVSVSLQSDVARDLSSVRTRCEKAISAITRQLDLLTERRQALITTAVTGNLDLRGLAA